MKLAYVVISGYSHDYSICHNFSYYNKQKLFCFHFVTRQSLFHNLRCSFSSCCIIISIIEALSLAQRTVHWIYVGAVNAWLEKSKCTMGPIGSKTGYLSVFQHCYDFPLPWADQGTKNPCPENTYVCTLVKANSQNTSSWSQSFSFLREKKEGGEGEDGEGREWEDIGMRKEKDCGQEAVFFWELSFSNIQTKVFSGQPNVKEIHDSVENTNR